jgi:hypothetical protein
MTKSNDEDSRLSAFQRILRGSTAYFAIVFGAGFILGPIRILWAVPRFGERNAELIETPIMLLMIVFAALAVKPLCQGRPAIALTIGAAVALALLVTAELSAVMPLRALTLDEYVANRDPVSGSVYLAMLVVFALTPWLVARRR